MNRLWRSLTAAILLLAITSGSTLAYDIDPQENYSPAAIADSEINVCFGINTSEGVYFHRNRILNELEINWGTAFGTWQNSSLNFTDDGLCHGVADEELRVLWDRQMDCSSSAPTYGYAKPEGGDWFTEWDYATIWLNADCEIRGKFDWTYLLDGIAAGKMSALWTVDHEFGHALGVDHFIWAWETDQLMWQNVGGHACGGLGNHVMLNDDDRAAVMDVYDEFYTVWQGGSVPWGPCLP